MLWLSIMDFAERVTRARYPMRDPSRPQGVTPIGAQKEFPRYEVVTRQCV
jgi:hypothetical protein